MAQDLFACFGPWGWKVGTPGYMCSLQLGVWKEVSIRTPDAAVRILSVVDPLTKSLGQLRDHQSILLTGTSRPRLGLFRSGPNVAPLPRHPIRILLGSTARSTVRTVVWGTKDQTMSEIIQIR